MSSYELEQWLYEHGMDAGNILHWLMTSVDEDALVDSLNDMKTAVEDGNY